MLKYNWDTSNVLRQNEMKCKNCDRKYWVNMVKALRKKNRTRACNYGANQTPTVGMSLHQQDQ